jgi:lipoate-protein ligase A
MHAWIGAAFAAIGVATELASEPSEAGPGQCFVGWEKFDLLWQGRKVAGAAQRRRKDGLLIQGSIQPPPGVSRPSWETAMCSAQVAQQTVAWKDLIPDSHLCERADQLAAEKYSRTGYNQKR